MKKLLSFVFVVFMFVACGDSPESVAKKCMTAAVDVNVEQIVKCTYFDSEKEKQRYKEGFTEKDIDKIKKYFLVEMGGVKSIETSLVEMNKAETTAKVKVVMTFNNGEVKSGEENLIKINGTWYFEKPLLI